MQYKLYIEKHKKGFAKKLMKFLSESYVVIFNTRLVRT